MATLQNAEFLAGVIEGFYGKPWSWPERLELFEWMAKWRLDTYLYAPKDDLKHRALWRERYTPAEAADLGEVIRACAARGLRFIYALGPGLDIRYSDEADRRCLERRFEQLLGLGGRDFALLFDDIPDRMTAADARSFPSFASAQCSVANALFRWTRERSPDARFFFCPTPYCGRMAGSQVGGAGYLPTLGGELAPEMEIFWTGPEIVSREIQAAPIRELAGVLRRQPVIWDNLHANDYDGRRFYCGPYSGRPTELRREVRGLLCNPNNEFPLNYVPLRTFAEFARRAGAWHPRAAYLAAMRAWLPHFAVPGRAFSFDDLVLFGDAFYLPYETGPEAEALLGQARNLLSRAPAEWGPEAAVCRRQAARLRAFCLRLAQLRYRPLFYALSRRGWELGEELDLLERYFDAAAKSGTAGAPGRSDFHLPGTYRGGFLPELQRLLVQHPDGTFTPATRYPPMNDCAPARGGTPLPLSNPATP